MLQENPFFSDNRRFFGGDLTFSRFTLYFNVHLLSLFLHKDVHRAALKGKRVEIFDVAGHGW